MKPILFKVPRLTGETVRVEYWDMHFFYDPMHYHEECQLTYIIEGEGMLYMGSSVKNFKAGDVFLLGKNVPHVLRCNEEYRNGKSELRARAISVFFSLDNLISICNYIVESDALQKLLSYSNFGIKINGDFTANLFNEMKELLNLNGFNKVLEFLKILNRISQSEELTFISPQSIPIHSVVRDEPNIKNVYEYILKHSREKIMLSDVASIVHLSPSAFCRFFKTRTQKTFSRFLIEVRIGDVCRLLMEGKHNTTECAYLCGYNNISNFHRHFKNVVGMTTSQFKKSRERSVQYTA
jgi:AraC-like DNA-binding protein